MKKQRVTLEIVYDDEDGRVKEPSAWDWTALLDLASSEKVTVVHGGPTTTVKAAS